MYHYQVIFNHTKLFSPHRYLFFENPIGCKGIYVGPQDYNCVEMPEEMTPDEVAAAVEEYDIQKTNNSHNDAPMSPLGFLNDSLKQEMPIPLPLPIFSEEKTSLRQEIPIPLPLPIFSEEKTFLKQETILKRKESTSRTDDDGSWEVVKKDRANKEYSTVHSTKDSHKDKKFRYICILCKDSFKSATLLNNHVKRNHTKIKQYKCTFPYCFAAYTTKSSLYLHIARTHEEKKYICRECGKPFSLSGDLNQHIKRVHN